MQKLLFELLWWIVTAVIVVAVMFPIWSSVENFPVYRENITFIIIFVTLTRYIFLLKHTFLAKLQWLKVLIVLISAPCIFVLVEMQNAFQTNLDNIGADYVTQGVKPENILHMVRYVKNEFTFFSVGSIMTALFFPIRMIISVWRLKNKGTV
jgi:hypothetical protein